jgi:hypothetical protein
LSKQDDGVGAFWRETDVWLFSPLARINKLIGLLAGLLITALGVYLLGKAMPEWPAAIVSIATTLTLGMFGLCCEMYYKGGKSGAGLKSQLNSLQSAINDPEILDYRINVLQDTANDLLAILERDRVGFPKAGRADTLPKQQAEATAMLRQEVAQCLKQCSERVDGSYRATLDVGPILFLDDHTALTEAVRHKVIKLTSLLERIDPIAATKP